MIYLSLTHAWPVLIPLPILDYAGRPRYATISSPKENAFIARRSRFRRSYLAAAVSWMLTPAEYDAFQAFYLTDLGNGVALFSLELRYPKNSELTPWAVRFRGGYTGTSMEGIWNITSELDLVTPLEVGVLAGATGFFTDYEAFDIAAGLTIEEEEAPGYDVLEYLDVALGSVLEEDATPEEMALTDTMDEIYGHMVETDTYTYTL